MTFTALSRYKQSIKLPSFNLKIGQSILDYYDKVREASKQPAIFDMMPCNIEEAINTIKRFDFQFNEIICDLTSFRWYVSVKICNAYVCILSQTDDSEYVALIIHAIHVICQLYGKLDGWKIYVRLDNNQRHDFSVGGVTWYREKTVVCTKREEIIKLLFHELIHVLRVNDGLLVQKMQYPWNTTDHISLTEAHTETLAVVLHSAYVSIITGLSFDKILNDEYAYTFWLSANILKKLDVTVDTFINVPRGTVEPIHSKVQVWAYVFVRAIAMTKLNEILDCVDPNQIARLLSQNNRFVHDLRLAYDQTEPIVSLSYVMYDIDAKMITF